ncbi:hypothetical protein ELY10_05585 [Legionella septentrionalis]|nr:hypothetical protein ELY10_05585 [Legionella septentrionalis]
MFIKVTRCLFMSFIQLGKKLGYFKGDENYSGFLIRWLEACLVNEEKDFLERIKRIEQYHSQGTQFLEKVSTLKKKVISWKNLSAEEKISQTLTAEEQNILDVLAFYESILLYDAALLNGKRIEQTSHIASSESIQREGGLLRIHSQAAMLSSKEIDTYFKEMAGILNLSLAPQETVGITLRLSYHSIALTYQPQAGWTLVDHRDICNDNLSNNRQVLGYDLSCLAIFCSDLSKNYIPFSIDLFTTGRHPQLEQLKTQFAAFKIRQNTKIVERFDECGYGGIDLAYMAVQNRDASALVKLAQKGADLNKMYKTYLWQKDDDRYNLAFLAAMNGDAEILDILAKNNVDLHKPSRGVTPMELASSHGHGAAIAMLHQHGVSVNQRGDGRWSPAHYAASKGHDSALATLKQLGADLNAQTEDGMTPLCLAAFKNQGHIVAQLLNDEQVDCNLRAERGYHAIHYAAFAGNEIILNLFKDRGFDLHMEDAEGSTIAHFLALGGHKALIEKLMTQELDFNKKNARGFTPLHYAAEGGQLDIVEFFATKNFDLNVENNEGQTIAHIAAMENQTALLPFLAAQGVDMAKEDNHGFAPLMCAAKSGSKDAFMELTKYGIGKNIPYIAIEHEQSEIIQALTELKIDFKDEASKSYSENELRKIIASHLNPGETIPQKIETRLRTFIKQKSDKEKIPITPYEFALLLGKDKIVRIFNQQNPKTTELLTSLQTLKEHGETIKNKNKENKKEEAGKENAKDLNTIEGEKAILAADALETLACLYFSAKSSPNPDSKAIEKIQDSFKQQLAQTYKDLSTHRALWKPILANILIAATGIGLLGRVFKVFQAIKNLIKSLHSENGANGCQDLLLMTKCGTN